MSLINTIMDKYENLSVRKKALADILGMFSVAVVAGIAVNVVGMYGYWTELAIAFVMVTIVALLKTMYDIRVAQHKAIENLKK